MVAVPAPEPPPKISAGLTAFARKSPFLGRKLHPVTVHFTVAFMYAAPFFNILYLGFGHPAFEVAAFHCLGAGVLSTPAALLTGLLTQRFNYPDKDPQSFALEKKLSWLLLALSLGTFLWRLWDPNILIHFSPLAPLYLILTISLAPLVTIISFFGGSLTFPIPRETTED
jgi:uncharacterized membrane protein